MDETTEKAISMLGDLLSALGWVMLEPDDEDAVEGVVIGTPAYIDGWIERQRKLKGDLQ